jgi:alcohol dehydrogenase
MAKTMRAARLHKAGEPFTIDEIPIPEPGPDDALIAVKACGVIPNMRNIVSGKFFHVLPPMPAVIGLDAAGTVAKVGRGVSGLKEGERVYVNPALSCGVCWYCRNGRTLMCEAGALQGYFGFRPESKALLERYPYGGFAQYMTAPARNLVRLTDAVSFEVGARFGYLGTAYAGLQAGEVKAGDTVALIGGTGTLGINATIFLLGMGARVIPIARNADRLARMKALAPSRIHPVVIDGTPLAPRIKAAADGLGADMIMDCLTRGVPADMTADSIMGLRRGGIVVNIGALSEPLTINPIWFMIGGAQYRGSNWFSTAQGEQMAALAQAGAVDFGIFENRIYPLEKVNDALAEAGKEGGFINAVVRP